MKQQVIVTNLRIPYNDWVHMKALAGDLGMSVNEYVIQAVRNDGRKRILGTPNRKHKGKKESLIEEVERISRMPNKPMGWSKEDEEIYSI